MYKKRLEGMSKGPNSAIIDVALTFAPRRPKKVLTRVYHTEENVKKTEYTAFMRFYWGFERKACRKFMKRPLAQRRRAV